MILDQSFKESLLKSLIDLFVIMKIEECPITDKYSLFIFSTDNFQIKSSCGPVKTPVTVTFEKLLNSDEFNIFEVVIAGIRKHVLR